ncbi:hypothetical protein [Stenotrophomonas sp. SY1]|uniref:DUF7716 domain-containing protein n=1 Tax=Stenotrophomonas sp. SY1 TaxID=477235 RepID=UPI001E2C76E2|nr:hypothetical protein [Stenotrophomonas sp. SY1]MCD9086048.1 hypothetical protein [Stenotrophomonas sp. SY1]
MRTSTLYDTVRLPFPALPAQRRMIELLDLRQTLDTLAACNDDGEVWERYGWVHATEGGALVARFWLPPSEEEAWDEDDEVAIAARALGLSSFLEPATFADVLDVQKRQRPLSTLEDYARALDYYAEYDAFLQVPGIDEALGEASAAEQEAAQVMGVGPGIFASFDVVLVACPAEHMKDAASRVAALLAIPVGEALARCRMLPLSLGQHLDRRRCGEVRAPFEEIGATLQVHAYRPFPWPAEPSAG